MIALVRASRNCERGCYKGLSLQVFSWKIKILVVDLKGLVAKTN
jgi:hypothetical protein